MYAWHTWPGSSPRGMRAVCHRKNLTTLTTAVIVSKAMGQTSWRPDQAPSAGLPCDTASFKECCKTSACSSLTLAPMTPVLPCISMEAESLYFMQEMEMGDSELQLFAILNCYWEQWVSVFFCYCTYPISLLKHWHFHSLRFTLPNMFVYMSCTVQSMGSARMFALPRKVKQRVHQNVSPFPSPKKNQ